MYYSIGTLLLGLFIRYLSIRSMKGAFSLRIETPSKICTTGAYKYSRHPSYVGTILVIVGMCLISEILAIIYLAFMFFLARAIQEEIVLEQIQGYSEYKQKTGMFLPRIK